MAEFRNRIAFLLPFALFIMGGSSCHLVTKENVSTPIPAPPRAVPHVQDTMITSSGPQFPDPTQQRIISATDTLYKGDTLKIIFKTPHSKDLGIFDPDGVLFYLVHRENSPAYPSLANWSAFGNMKELKIITNKTKAPLLDSLATQAKIIFVKSGSYSIALSPDLAMAHEPLELHKVCYFNRPKPKRSNI